MTGLSIDARATGGLTRVGWRLVLIITALSVAHHVDHVVRGVTGWPFAGGFNPFSASLFVYPVIGTGVLLSRAQRAGPAFWSALAGGGAVFILALHVGPAAGDNVAEIPGQYDSAFGDAVALTILFALVASLVVHCSHEIRRMLRRRSA